jgi:hypothetical protein
MTLRSAPTERTRYAIGARLPNMKLHSFRRELTLRHRSGMGAYASVDHNRAILARTCPHWARNNCCGTNSHLAISPRTALTLLCGGRGIGGALGRTAGFVAVAESIIASLSLFEPGYSLKLTHSVDLLAFQIYAVAAALTVELFVASSIVPWRKDRRQFQRKCRQRRVLPTVRSRDPAWIDTQQRRPGSGLRSTMRQLESHTSVPTARGSRGSNGTIFASGRPR